MSPCFVNRSSSIPWNCPLDLPFNPLLCHSNCEEIDWCFLLLPTIHAWWKIRWMNPSLAPSAIAISVWYNWNCTCHDVSSWVVWCMIAITNHHPSSSIASSPSLTREQRNQNFKKKDTVQSNGKHFATRGVTNQFERIFHPTTICLSICLSVCLFVGILRRTRRANESNRNNCEHFSFLTVMMFKCSVTYNIFHKFKCTCSCISFICNSFMHHVNIRSSKAHK